MSIDLIIKPRQVVSWEEFCRTVPPFSIGLDGYVRGAPQYDSSGPRLNLNHHEGVDRLATSSTSGQVFNYVKAELFRRFQEQGIPEAIIHINDPDQDTSLAVWLLRNHGRIERYKSEPLLSRLIFAQDKMDIFGGLYPFEPQEELMQELFWIFQPYSDARHRVPTMGTEEMRTIVEAVGSRIDVYSVGRGEKLAIDVRTHYEILHQGRTWSLVEEKGPHARTGLYHAGIHAFATYKGKTPANQHHYSLGKLSPFIEFSLTVIYDQLNQQEEIMDDDPDRWGGGDTQGGSPRNRGSQFAPQELFLAIEGIQNRFR